MYLRCDQTFIEHPSLIVDALMTQGIRANVVGPFWIVGDIAGREFRMHLRRERFVVLMQVVDSNKMPLFEMEKASLVSMLANPELTHLSSADGIGSIRSLLDNAELADAWRAVSSQLSWEVVSNPNGAEIAYVESHFPESAIARDLIVEIRRKMTAMRPLVDSQQFELAAQLADERERLLTHLYHAVMT